MSSLRPSSAPHCHVSLGTGQRCHPTLVTSKDRDGHTFASETDQLQNVWEQHQLTTLKAIEPTFCQFCDQWILQPLAECGYSASPWVERFFRVSVCSVTTTNHSLSISASLRSLERDIKSTYTINTSSHSTHPPPVPAIHPCAQNLRQ
jgi:hypothetical protein